MENPLKPLMISCTAYGRLRGFSLIEVAIALLILSIIISSSMLPITNLLRHTKYKQAQQQLLDIQQRLLAHTASQAMQGAYLPCSDCRSDPCPGGVVNDGLEDRRDNGRCSVFQTEIGNLPWATLGLASHDPWGNRYSFLVLNKFSNMSKPFTLTEPNVAASSRDEYQIIDEQGKGVFGVTIGAVAVVFSHGNNAYGGQSMFASSQAVGNMPPLTHKDEWENLNGDLVFVHRPVIYRSQADYEYDDALMWIAPQQIRGYLIQAGRFF